MKKIILFFLFLFVSNSYAGVWSSMSKSGFNGAYVELNDFVKNQNSYIEKFWNEEIKPIIDKIAKKEKEKEKKLKILRELEKNNLITDKKIEFLLNQKKELLSNEANIISK